MPHPRMSIGDWNLKDFKSTCKLLQPIRKDGLSTSFLLRKGPLSLNSISNLTTLEYLEQFRKKLACLDNEEEGEDSTEFPEEFCDEEEEVVKDVCCGVTGSFSSVRLTAAQLEDERVLEEFWYLKVIDICGTGIKNVRNLGAMPYLEIINASHNLLETILEILPPAPASFKELDFSHNKISTVNEMKEYWSLTRINLSHNELTSVQGFAGLEFLQDLDLSYNKIAALTAIDCPNLFNLNMSFNELECISENIGCHNLHFLNLQNNNLSDISSLKYLTQLTDLDITDNKIDDLTQFEHLKPLLNLSRLKIHPNPITSTMENLRLVLVHVLPQILWLDESYIEPSEVRAATNMLNPSMEKLAYLDYTTILLSRASRSSNSIFDSFCRNRPIPPILLIVGPPRSHCHTIALLLKEKFRNKVFLGGVHSTATTIEGSHPKLDIPISYESFLEMKNNGEFLSTCKILGRICGFASSQIGRAAERSALLVAAVPLKTALALRHWNLNPKLVLALPSTLPEFPLDSERDQAIQRSIVSENSEGIFPRRKSGGGEDLDEVENPEAVHFQEMLSIVLSSIGESDQELYGEDEDEDENGEEEDTLNHHDMNEKIRQHSILRAIPHFEVGVKIEDDDEMEDDEMEVHVVHQRESDTEAGGFGDYRDSHVHLTRLSDDDVHVIDMEKKKSTRLKSIAPGSERYSLENGSVDEYLEDLAVDLAVDIVEICEEAALFLELTQPHEMDHGIQNMAHDPSSSLLQPNELYSNYQPQKPGFINSVLHSTDLCDKNQEDNLVLDALMHGKADSVVDLIPIEPPPSEETNQESQPKCGHQKRLSRKCVHKKRLSRKSHGGGDEEQEDEEEWGGEGDEYEEEQEQEDQDDEDEDEDVTNEEQEEEQDDVEEEETVEPGESDETQEIEAGYDEEEQTWDTETTMDEFQVDEMGVEEDNDQYASMMGEEEDYEEWMGEYEIQPKKRSSLKTGVSKKRSSLKIREPVHLPKESEDTLIDDDEECEEVPPMTHKEAMTLSILQTKELYSKFHAENPGFFHAVIDTADLCESYRVVENLALDALVKFKDDAAARTDKSQQGEQSSYAGANQADSKYFLADRLQKMKHCCDTWNRGRECGKERVRICELNSNRTEQSEVLLTQTTCPRNLLEPTTHRPPITLKMRKLVELTEKRAKCTNFEKSSDCSLPYRCKSTMQ